MKSRSTYECEFCRKTMLSRKSMKAHIGNCIDNPKMVRIGVKLGKTSLIELRSIEFFVK